MHADEVRDPVTGEADQNYCNAATDLRELVNDIQGRWEQQYEARSDRWKENSEDAPDAEDRLATITEWLERLPTEEDIAALNVEALG